MLVLTRKKSESIRIGNDIVIKVLQTGRGMVKLGIEAPAHIRVLRAELTEFATATATAVAVAVAGDPDINPADSEQDEDAVSGSEEECPLDFNTEYAVDIEDQMLCVVAAR